MQNEIFCFELTASASIWVILELSLLPDNFGAIRASLPWLGLTNPSCLSITGAWNATLECNSMAEKHSEGGSREGWDIFWVVSFQNRSPFCSLKCYLQLVWVWSLYVLFVLFSSKSKSHCSLYSCLLKRSLCDLQYFEPNPLFYFDFLFRLAVAVAVSKSYGSIDACL